MFLPELLSLMTENGLRVVCQRLGEEGSVYAPSQVFTKYITKQTLAMYISCMYAIHLMEKRELRSFNNLLPVIAKCYVSSSDGTQLPDLFLHVLVHHIVSQGEGLKTTTLQVMFKEFWMPCCQVITI